VLGSAAEAAGVDNYFLPSCQSLLSRLISLHELRAQSVVYRDSFSPKKQRALVTSHTGIWCLGWQLKVYGALLSVENLCGDWQLRILFIRVPINAKTNFSHVGDEMHLFKNKIQSLQIHGFVKKNFAMNFFNHW